MRAAITAANSSVGRSLLGHIAGADGVSAVAGVRRQQAADSLPAAENIRPVLLSYEDPAALADTFAGTDAVIHLAGVLFEDRTRSYRRANVETTRAVVEAARQAGAGHLVFVSALGADAASRNAYLRSKGEAEELVTASGLAATVIRTPLLLGPGTAGAAALTGAAARGRALLLGGGRHVVRPLDMDDLSRALLRACASPPEGAVIHELVGPEALSYRELVRRTAAVAGRSVRVLGVPIAPARWLASLSYRIRRVGVSPDVVDVITGDETVAVNAAGALGIELTPLEETLGKLVAAGREGR